MSKKLLYLPINNPYITLIISLLILVISAIGLLNLRFSDDIRVFFDKDNKQLQEYIKLEDTYSKSNSVLFVIEPKDGDIFTRETLQAIEDITSLAWQMPYCRRVDSLTNFQNTYAVGDDLIVEDLASNSLNLSEKKLKFIKDTALTEPMLVGRLLSKSGHVAGVNVPINLPGVKPLVEQPAVAKAARQVVQDIEAKYPNIKVHLTGLIMINNALAEAGKGDMETLIPLMFIVILGVMALLLKNVIGVAVTFLVILFSIVIAMGLAGHVGIVLSPPVLSASNIIMTVAVADSVHILVSFLGHYRKDDNKELALKKALDEDFMPIMITSVTTALGFLSMNFSESPPFRDLGNIVAFGVIAAFILTITVMPAMLTILNVKPGNTKQKSSDIMKIFGQFVVKHECILLYSISVLAVILAMAIPKNEMNDEFVKYFDADIPFRKATDFTIDNMTGFEFIEYSIKSSEAGGINNPNYLKKLEEFALWYRGQDKVKHVYSYSDIIKRLNKNMHADDDSWYKTPSNRELAAQYLLLYELSLPFGLDLTNQIDIDKSATRFRVSLANITTNEMLAIEKKADQWIAENAKDVFTASGSGQSLMFAHIGSSNIKSLLQGSVIALFLISFLLIFAFRSVRFGVLSLVPNLLPAIMAFGLWGMLVGHVGLGLSVVVGMTLGIVVDDTVHFLTSYLRATREKNMNPQDAIIYSFGTVGRAITITSIVLIAGFAILAMSNFELNSGMATLSAVTIFMALVADFLLLPALILWMDRNR